MLWANAKLVFMLHSCRFFVTCLWEEFEILIRELAHITSSLRQTMSPDDDATAQRGFELLDLATSCLVCALQVCLYSQLNCLRAM